MDFRYDGDGGCGGGFGCRDDCRYDDICSTSSISFEQVKKTRNAQIYS